MLAPLAALLVPFLFWPAGFGLLSSFTSYAPAQSRVRFIGLQNYVTALENPDLRLAFRNIGVFLVAAVPAELALGFVLAYALREPFRGRGLVRVCLLVPWLLSPVATGVTRHFVSGRVAVLDWILAWLRLPPPPSPLTLPGLARGAIIATGLAPTARPA